ncbi:hypothetical protein BV898_07652 [Hypsibius exemplaris]|uniref:Thrombospondin type-1 domain-containing protein 1 n=1 Tax=Hypsibius exemplaris TaxID=2072580 RepID=A0A1W0WST2_HYPEX|nr:hypothetical protein BV898_07652 [Hypsibius exemplaris]
MKNRLQVVTLDILLFFLGYGKTFCSDSGPVKPPDIELHTRPVHYLFSGDLRLTYRVLSLNPDPTQLYTAKLTDPNTLTTISSTADFVLAPVNTWAIIEFPCSLMALPGNYTVKVVVTSTQIPADNAPEIVAAQQPVQIKWLDLLRWNLSSSRLRIFGESLTVNVSLATQTACPQEEPGNFTVVIELHYRQSSERKSQLPGSSGADRKIAQRALQWPFGATRSPTNSSITFPCWLFDRTGWYYATLAVVMKRSGEIGKGRLLRNGPTETEAKEEEAMMSLDKSPLVEAVHNVSDYELMISGDVGKCRNMTSQQQLRAVDRGSVRVTYRAPGCIGEDKIRLYRLDRQRIALPRTVGNLNLTYIMERSVRSKPRRAGFNFPCTVLAGQQDALGFCWIYATSSRDGQSRELTETRQCFPFSSAAEKDWKINQQQPQWSEWSLWTPCTETCRSSNQSRAVRMRKRVCQRKADSGIYRSDCEGPSLETRPCLIPFCRGVTTEKEHKSFGNIFMWFPGPGNLVNNRTSIFLYGSYENYTEGSTFNPLHPHHSFLIIALPALGGLLLLLICCVLPDLAREALQNAKRRSKPASGKAANRDSHHPLISKEDELPASSMSGPGSDLKYASIDQPSRSGVLEMQILASMAGKMPDANSGDAPQNQPDKAPEAVPNWPSHVPSPLILQRACRDRRFKYTGSSDQSPRSSSHLSSRPEPGDDVDFEYDDFIPDKFASEEELWTPQRLDIKVFATAYEDIVKELNAAAGADQQAGPSISQI